MAAKTDWRNCGAKGVVTVGSDRAKNNSSGFSALPAGYRNISKSFKVLEEAVVGGVLRKEISRVWEAIT